MNGFRARSGQTSHIFQSAGAADINLARIQTRSPDRTSVVTSRFNRIFDLYLSSEIPFKYYGACLLCYAKLEVSLYIVWFRRPMKH